MKTMNYLLSGKIQMKLPKYFVVNPKGKKVVYGTDYFYMKNLMDYIQRDNKNVEYKLVNEKGIEV